MKSKIPELSVFFPAYNEEENIKNTTLKAKKVLQKVAKRWEIILVDDGSKDRTGDIIEELSKSDKRIKAVHHKVNKGYGGAFSSGLYSSKYDWITFTDADGQFDFGEITNFIDKQKETNADIVVGYYKKRRVSKSVVLTSKLWEALVFILFGLKVRDIDCGFKLISKKIPEKIDKLESERGAFVNSEFLIKTKRSGFKIVEIPVTHYPRAAGTPTGRNLNVIIQSFTDLIKLWGKLR